MKIGTKSILFGAHCFFLHPFFVALAWIKLYGFPFSIPIWVSFFVHDIGYWGKPNIDGPEGETHPYKGAYMMEFLFGSHWYWFTLFHSRFLARKWQRPYTRLCVADKYAFVITPTWLYLPMVKLSGEVKEFMQKANVDRNSEGENSVPKTPEEWLLNAKIWTKKWVMENKHCTYEVFDI